MKGIPKPLFFDHIPKTGGMTVHQFLVSRLPASACSPILNATYSEARAEFNRYSCVSGHIQYEPGAALSDLWAFTILRDPVDRAISQYCYSRSAVAPTGNRFNELAKALDIAAFIESEEPVIRPNIANAMVSHFCTLKWDGRTELTTGSQLALAKEALGEFELVGLTERLEETIDILCARLGLVPPDAVPLVNANSRRVPIGELPTGIRRQLSQLNELDNELYSFATDIHNRQRRQVIFSAPSRLRDWDRETPAHRDPTVVPLIATAPAEFGNGKARIVSIEVYGSTIFGPTVLAGETAIVRVSFESREALHDVIVGIRISDALGRLIFGTNTRALGKTLACAAGSTGNADFKFTVAIGVGEYWVGAAIHPSTERFEDYYHRVDRAARFEVAGNIGWHFEGMVKLNPTVSVVGATVTLRPADDESGLVQRLGRHAPPLTDFSSEMIAGGPVPRLARGDVVALCVEVINTGTERWWNNGERCVNVSYRWLNGNGRIVAFDGERTPLPCVVEPGERIPVWVRVSAPNSSGDFVLRLTLVQEFVGWFDEHGGGFLELPIVVVDDRGQREA